METKKRSKRRVFAITVALLTGLGLLLLLFDMRASGVLRRDLPEPVYKGEEQGASEPELTEQEPIPLMHDGKMELNTADLAMLDSLPGIGEKLAKRIIDFRKKQPFKQIRDVKKVSGIGDALFDKIKDKIYVAGEPSE